MFRHCSTCQLDIPVQFWTQHKRQHKRQQPGARDGRTASQALKAKVKLRDQHRCQACGRQDSPGDPLEVHHRNGQWTDNRMDNLVSLCSSCHDQADSQLRQARQARQAMAS